MPPKSDAMGWIIRQNSQLEPPLVVFFPGGAGTPIRILTIEAVHHQ